MGPMASRAGATAGGVLFVLSHIKQLEADNELATIGQASQGWAVSARNPEHCAAFVGAQEVANNLRVVAVASLFRAGVMGIGTGIYMGEKELTAHVGVGVGVNSIRMVFVW